MITRSIAADDREHFFSSFSRLHRGALIALNVDAHVVVADEPFGGISCDTGELIVHVGNGARRLHLGHRIPRVRGVQLEQTDEGADAAVEITSRDGTRTVVRFLSPLLPELLETAVE